MKELSIEEKAKAYDNAFRIAKELYDNPNSSNIGKWYVCTVFPELKKSDDEKIRKALIQNLKERFGTKGTMGGILDMPKVLAWLEKQGEHANFRNKIQIGDKVTRNEAGILVNISQLHRVAKERKKQGEQKPIDNVERKFRNGQWIVWQDKCYKVNYNGCGYELVDQNGLSTSLEYGTVDNDAHLWDITKDAKGGDVLYHKAENGIEYIVMSKGLNEFNNIDSYFRYNSIDGFSIDVPSVLSAKCDSITPATKEQRDTLFKAMANAEYTWDAEKKELKKIEKNPAWSEEDEAMLYSAIAFVEHSAFTTIGKGKGGVVAWLKSLKDRYTWKPSVEQMDALLVKIPIGNNCSKVNNILKSLYSDLKRLK